MELTRRNFLKFTAATGTIGVSGAVRKASAHSGKPVSPDWLGVLVDTTVCIGCRKCEWACNNVNKLSEKSITEFEDKSVFEKMRRPDEKSYTVVNQYENPNDPQLQYYVKVQCMHCNDAACVSACIVGALTKHPETGAVHYDPWKCIGCRYCMAACPFQIPAYEYQNALTPQVRKCTFCFDRINEHGGLPGCVEICPVEALTFGKRTNLIKLAREKIAKEPDRYIDHIYGEHELGGTSWMYLSGKPMHEMDMERFGERSIPSYTEPVQHAIFKNFVPPISLFAFLGIIMKLFKNHDEANAEKGGTQ
ncbi:MAG: 4Fe-4S dicluster domain-containing protein [candidate division KSB1 bacterium]|nr:4Fe-4S dicluster domain-containing protein [candidate division KSB1 bacterium]